jgi:hypothetical protein
MAGIPLDPRVVQETLNNLNQVSTVMAATMDMLIEKEHQLSEVMSKVADRFEEMALDAKRTVSQTDALEGEFRGVLRAVYDMNRSDFFRGKALGDIKKRLEEIHKVAMRVSKDPDYGKGHQAAALRALGTIEKILGEIKKKAEAAGGRLNEALDPQSAEEFSDAMRKAGGSIEAVNVKAQRMHGVIFNTLKTVRQLEPLMKLFEHRPAPVERRGMFERKVAKGGDAVKGFLRSIPLDKEGRPDTRLMSDDQRKELRRYANRISRTQDKNLDRMVGEISGREGMAGALDRWRTKKALQSAASQVLAGGEITGGAETTIGRVVAGGGSWTAGLEGVMSGIGEADILVGALYALKKGFDGMIESNRDLYSRLGTGGGLFTGPQAPASALQNVRMNLTPLLNLYGQTYDSNLKMAEAITKFGVSVGDLSDLGNDLNNNIIGKAGGPVGGGIATTVFGGARLAGLDQVAATEQVMKLLQQYHESLEGTDAFFNKLNMDTKAAGITSVKYIQILDEISGQFDHMARGIDDVTSALRMLGHTGILTSEQVTDALKAMTTKTTPEVGAFLAMQPAFAQKTARALRAAQTADVGTQAENAYNALVDAFQSTGMTKEDAAKRLKAQGITVDTLSDMRTDMRTNVAAKATMVAGQVLTGVGDATKKQAVGSALENLQAGRQALQATTNYLANPTRGALELAFQPNMGPAAAVAMNITKLQQVLMRAGGLGQTPEAAMRTFILHPEQMAGRAMEINQLANALQLNPEDIPKLRTAVMAGAGAEIQDALKGALPTEEYQKIAGYLGMGAGATKEDVIGRLGSSTDDQTTAMEGLSSDWDTFTQLWERGGPLSKTLEDSAKAQGLELKTQAARDLGMALTTTNDYLKEITDFLTHQIYELMTDILEAIPGHKVNPAEQARKVAELERSRGMAGDTNAILKSMTGELGDFGPKATVQTDLDKARNIQANLQAEVDRMRGDVADAQAAAEKDPTKKAAADKAASDLADKQQMLMQVGATVDSSQKALQQFQDYEAGKTKLTETQAEGIQGVFEGLQHRMGGSFGGTRYDLFYHPERALPRGAQPGAAATSPAVEGVRPAAEKGTSIKTTNVSNSVTMGLAQAAPAKPVAPEKSTEAVNPDTAGVAKAVVDQHKAASTRTMVQ